MHQIEYVYLSYAIEGNMYHFVQTSSMSLRVVGHFGYPQGAPLRYPGESIVTAPLDQADNC